MGEDVDGLTEDDLIFILALNSEIHDEIILILSAHE